MSHIKLYDTVALLKPLPEYNLQKGQVGSIVMVHDDSHFEVEFIDASGHTLALCILSAGDLLLLRYEAAMHN
jgi:hypothetical protein